MLAEEGGLVLSFFKKVITNIEVFKGEGCREENKEIQHPKPFQESIAAFSCFQLLQTTILQKIIFKMQNPLHSWSNKKNLNMLNTPSLYFYLMLSKCFHYFDYISCKGYTTFVNKRKFPNWSNCKLQAFSIYFLKHYWHGFTSPQKISSLSPNAENWENTYFLLRSSWPLALLNLFSS